MSKTPSHCGWAAWTLTLVQMAKFLPSFFFFFYMYASIFVPKQSENLLTSVWGPRCAALLEVQFLEGEVSLHNASGLDPGPQYVLLGGDVICFSYPLQVVQVAEEEREERQERDFKMVCNLQERDRNTTTDCTYTEAHGQTGQLCTCDVFTTDATASL